MNNRYLKFLFSLLLDFLVADISMLAAIQLTDGFSAVKAGSLIYSLVFFPMFFILFAHFFHVYHTLWRFAVWQDFMRIAAADITAIALCIIVHRVFGLIFSIGYYCVFTVLSAFLLCSVRVLYRQYLNHSCSNSHNDDMLRGNIMLIGAGSAGNIVIEDINVNHNSKNCKVRCVIDDDPLKKGHYVSGVLIVGGRDEIISAAKKYDIDMIVFAIPACPKEQRSAILRICQKTHCELRIIPSVVQLLTDSREVVKSVKKVEIEDLLGREPIKMDIDVVMNYVSGKTVLVTGGGGSIGSELCRQIASHSPKLLIIFDIYENNAYDIQNELKREYPELKLETLIGSVRDTHRLDAVFARYKPDIVYHAAAHKHVPLMEDSPNETIKNNVFGTYKTALCAAKYGVQRFILISTDKAVNPTNIMGASKRICEMIIQSFNSLYDTEYVAVRFGNVLGSNGSVIPLFKKQIAEGGPVTVTDPNIIRYFMTIPEAVSLVLQAGASAKGGEIFVLDMGEPVRILDLAENLIRLSGYEPYVDINIKFTGLRPGEKLYEEMLMSEEGLQQTDNHLIFIGHPIDFDENEFKKVLFEMKEKMYDENADIRAYVKKLVPTYNYTPASGSHTDSSRNKITV